MAERMTHAVTDRGVAGCPLSNSHATHACPDRPDLVRPGAGLRRTVLGVIVHLVVALCNPGADLQVYVSDAELTANGRVITISAHAWVHKSVFGSPLFHLPSPAQGACDMLAARDNSHRLHPWHALVLSRLPLHDLKLATRSQVQQSASVL